MFFIPIRTDNRIRHTPVANYALIAANVLIFLFQPSLRDPAINRWLLDPANPHLWTFFSYQFLHANLVHVLGNMLFLYIFGNSINDRLGNIGYIAFYLAGGIFAGLGHVLVAGEPVLGASGAVCAVTGAYLVLFPMVRVTIFYWIFFFIGTFKISSMVLILFQVGTDALTTLLGEQTGVANFAHMSGYVFGFAVAVSLLAVGLLQRDRFDILALLRQWRRRQQYRATVAAGYDPFFSRAPRRRVSSVVIEQPPQPTQTQLKVSELRGAIFNALSVGDLPGAARGYEQLVAIDPTQVLPAKAQLDVANQLMSGGQHALAAEAYEKFLKHYPNYEHAEQIQLVLGIVYGRYLGAFEKALSYLRACYDRLTDASQRQMCQAEIEHAMRNLAGGSGT